MTRAVVHAARELGTTLTEKKVHYLLYIVYAKCLVDQGRFIFPVRWLRRGYGPAIEVLHSGISRARRRIPIEERKETYWYLTLSLRKYRELDIDSLLVEKGVLPILTSVVQSVGGLSESKLRKLLQAEGTAWCRAADSGAFVLDTSDILREAKRWD
jgi:uncharacterized phage-associated protein